MIGSQFGISLKDSAGASYVSEAGISEASLQLLSSLGPL